MTWMAYDLVRLLAVAKEPCNERAVEACAWAHFLLDHKDCTIFTQTCKAARKSLSVTHSAFLGREMYWRRQRVPSQCARRRFWYLFDE